jgi:hypothetical protein
LRRAYHSAIEAAKLLPPNDNEYLFSLRNIAACAIELQDETAFLETVKLARRVLGAQPEHNFLSSVQLAGTVGRGMAVFKMGDPFSLKEKVQCYFHRSVVGTRVYELSDIKTELETYLALGCRKDAIIQQRIDRGLILADEESERYKAPLLKLAAQF